MIEVLWHGRGGQGAFTAARLLGAASSLDEGRYALAFPSFGPERRGAPMRAFTKMDNTPIGDRSAIKRADYVVYLDETLFGDGWEQELKPQGIVLVNSARTFSDERIIALDANSISTEVLGRPIPNTVFLGALSMLVAGLSADDVKQAIRLYMPEKLHAANERIVDEARAALTDIRAQSTDATMRITAVPSSDDDTAAIDEDSKEDSVGEDAMQLAAALRAHELSERTATFIPTLRDDALDPASYARTTCFTAGYLVDKNAGWRNERPVVDESACVGCLQCYMQCPDGTVYKVAPAETVDEKAGRHARPKPKVAIDYDFCKGCGVCVRACKFNALRMVPEPEALAALVATKPAAEGGAR